MRFEPEKYVSIIYNFVCTHDSRLKILLNELPNIGNIFKDYNFYVNYNASKNHDIIKQSFEDNIKNLQFHNWMQKDWSRHMLKLLNNVGTPYFMMLTEDYVYNSTSADWFNIFEEAHKLKVKHIMFSKIKKYNDQNLAPIIKSKNHLIDGNYLHIWPAKYFVSPAFSTLAMNNTSVFKEVFKRDVKITKRKSPNEFEAANSGRIYKFGQTLCGVPKKIVCKASEAVKEN